MLSETLLCRCRSRCNWKLITEISVCVLTLLDKVHSLFCLSLSHPLLLNFPAKPFQLLLFCCSMLSPILPCWNCLPNFYFLIVVLCDITSPPLICTGEMEQILGRLCLKKGIIDGIHSVSLLWGFCLVFFPLTFLSCCLRFWGLGGVTCFVGRALSFGMGSFFFSHVHLPISQTPGIRHIWGTSLCSICFPCIVPFEVEVLI